MVIAFAWCFVMFFMMPYWSIYGKQNVSNEACRSTPEAFLAKAQAMVDKHTVRTVTGQNIPVAQPVSGGDVYLVARLWQWWPVLELEEHQTSRLHIPVHRPRGPAAPRSRRPSAGLARVAARPKRVTTLAR